MGIGNQLPTLSRLVDKSAEPDPDGDWVHIGCPKDRDVQTHGNAINWRMPWDFKGSRKVSVVAEDAWGARSKPFALTITST